MQFNWDSESDFCTFFIIFVHFFLLIATDFSFDLFKRMTRKKNGCVRKNKKKKKTKEDVHKSFPQIFMRVL